MRRIARITVLLLLGSFVAATLLSVRVQAASNSRGRLLLVYESRHPLLVKADYVNAMVNLLGHFNLRITSLSSDRYEPGLLSRYDYLMYLGNDHNDLPPAFIADIAVTSKPVMWIDANIDELVAQRKDLGWELEGTAFSLAQVEYLGRAVPVKYRQMMNSLRVGPDTKVWAWAKAGNTRTPFVVSKGSFWYVARMDFWKPYYYVIADILHDFLGADHETRARAFVRIEDIHPKRDAREIRAVTDELHAAGVPFMLAVIPVYQNPQTGEKVALHQAPALVEALRYAVARGGSVVLHGFTHQMGDSETGVGFEFWDDRSDSPLENETIALHRDRIEQAVAELASVGLRPLAFEPPHYAISSLGYYTVAQHFSTLVAAVQLDDQTRRINQTFPFVIHRDRYGLKIIPENLGYVDPSAPDAVQGPLSRAERALVVRDPMVGVFFHPYIEARHLRALVEGLRAKGYEFYDLSTDQHWVRTQALAFVTGAEPSSPAAPQADDPLSSLTLPIGATSTTLAGLVMWLMARRLRSHSRKTTA